MGLNLMSQEQVKNFYNKHVSEEDRRLEYHAFEVPVTMHFLEKYLKPGAKVLDVASGTGHYGRLLLEKGYKVGMSDIAENNMQLIKKRLGDHPKIIGIDCNDALQTNLWQEQPWDIILLLGPLYHYINKDKRVSLLKKAKDNLAPGGKIFAGFMSRVGALIYGMKNNPDGILDEKGAHHLWKYGYDKNFVESTENFNDAHVYFSNPHEIDPLLNEAGLKPLHLIGIEGIFGERFDEYHQMNEIQKKKWLEFIISFAEDDNMISNAKHLLSISQP